MTTYVPSAPTDSPPMVSGPSLSSMVGRLASPLRWLVGAVASLTTAGSGLSSSAWSARYDRHGWLRRIRPDCSRLNLEGRSVASSTRWTRWGMWARGERGELATLVPRISEIGSSYWPTMGTQDANNRASLTARRRNHNPRVTLGLTLVDAVRLYPTLNGHVSSDGETRARWTARAALPKARRRGEPLSIAVQTDPNRVDLLNPDWAELFMGFPLGWTDVGPLPGTPRRIRGSRRSQSNPTRAGDSD